MRSLRLRGHFVIFAIALFAATAGSPLSRGQSITNATRAASAQTVLLRQAARKAGFIFSGTVLSVQQLPSGPGGVIRVRITFSVHEAVRGVRQGKTFTVDQWAGLSGSQASQFRPGDRVFVLLYPRSKLGLTSVVAGGLGRYDLDSNWRIVGTNQKPGFVTERPSRPVPSRPSRVEAHSRTSYRTSFVHSQSDACFGGCPFRGKGEQRGFCCLCSSSCIRL